MDNIFKEVTKIDYYDNEKLRPIADVLLNHMNNTMKPGESLKITIDKGDNEPVKNSYYVIKGLNKVYYNFSSRNDESKIIKMGGSDPMQATESIIGDLADYKGNRKNDIITSKTFAPSKNTIRLLSDRENRPLKDYNFETTTDSKTAGKEIQGFSEQRWDELKRTDKTAAMGYLRDSYIKWNECDNPAINWMRACKAATEKINMDIEDLELPF